MARERSPSLRAAPVAAEARPLTDPPFRDRADAGRQLASHLARFAKLPDVVVLALPRGGVPVAFEVALALDAPLDVFPVRKLGVPGHEELALGAVALGGMQVLNRHVVERLRLEPAAVGAVAATQRRILEERARAYRGDRPAPVVGGRTVILVDDGLATGATMRAALSALRREQPARLVAAVPIGPPDICRAMAELADEVICAFTSERFVAVGNWYEDFSQTTDDQVLELLGQAKARAGHRRP